MKLDDNRFVADFRSGMSDADLLQKYGLTEKELYKLLQTFRLNCNNIIGAKAFHGIASNIDLYFRNFAYETSELVGSAATFVLVVSLLALWALTGPTFELTVTWLFLLNIIQTLIIFLIQNTQNRHYKAVQLKLNELVRAVTGARTAVVAVEHLPSHEINKLESEFIDISNHER